MKTDEAYAKTMPKRSNGIAKRQRRGLPTPNLIWVLCMATDKACAKTMPKHSDGIAKQQNRGMPMPNIIWV